MKRLSYGLLWKLLMNRHMKKRNLQIVVQFSRGMITKMGNDEPVGLDIGRHICQAFDYGIIDMVEISDALEEVLSNT